MCDFFFFFTSNEIEIRKHVDKCKQNVVGGRKIKQPPWAGDVW